MMGRVRLIVSLAIGVIAATQPGRAQNPPAQQAPAPPRPTPPTRDPNTPGYVTAKELPDGDVPPADAYGNFITGPTHPAAPGMTENGLFEGALYIFTMNATDSK